MFRFNGALALFPILLAAAGTARSQPIEPPGRIAQLAYIENAVAFQPAGFTEQVPAELNRPVTTADHLWTEPGARAELQTNNAEFRLGGQTSFTFLNLADDVTQVQMTTGVLNLRLHSLAPGEAFEVDTPQLSVALQAGDYRIHVNEQGDATTLTVRWGAAQIVYGTKTMLVPGGAQVRVTGVYNPTFMERVGEFTAWTVALILGGDPNLEQQAVRPPDRFDDWCAARDARLDNAASAQFVSRDIPGYADLDGQGDWTFVDAYGWVWFPTNQGQWAPYRFGHWAWIAPWGWTWIDAAVWGFAPSHYGNWVFVNDTWGWAPGQILARPRYSPAVVAFASFEAGVVVGSEPVVAWFPLSFGELVGVGVDYVLSRIGITAMVQSAFADGLASGRDSIDIPQRDLSAAQVGKSPGVAPNRKASLGARGTVHSTEPQKVADRGVRSQKQPPARPKPFEQQRSEAQHAAQAQRSEPQRAAQPGQRSEPQRTAQPGQRSEPQRAVQPGQRSGQQRAAQPGQRSEPQRAAERKTGSVPKAEGNPAPEKRGGFHMPSRTDIKNLGKPGAQTGVKPGAKPSPSSGITQPKKPKK
jgi:hypothetical protein